MNMSKLFVSYRRAAWSFTYWLAEELGKVLDAEIFVDYSGIDETNFQTSLLHNLATSDAVLVVITEHTFAPERITDNQDWVRREIREALTEGKPIVLACHNGLMPPSDLPPDIEKIREVQGIEFYPRFFKAGVHELATFIDRTTPVRLRQSVSSVEELSRQAAYTMQSDKALFDEATTMVESGQYDRALELLELLKTRGYRPRYVSLDEVMEDVASARDEEQSRWDAGEVYDEIAALARINLTRARRAWAQFQVDYPDFTDDPAQLAIRLSDAPPASQGLHTPPHRRKVRSEATIPAPFAWISIPAGNVTLAEDNFEMGYLKKGERKTIGAAAFSIAKYPVTNGQFAVFMELGGYRENKWWTEAGWQAREKEGWVEPRFWKESRFNRSDCPVVGVSWYEAMAFCRWLSDESGENIVLPTEEQWQRAAQGDSGLLYPWGNEWDGERCNNRVAPFRSEGPSPVTQYEGKGESPFGVADMCGNVWEWCLTDFDTGRSDASDNNARVLRGGSWWGNSPRFLRAAVRNWNNPSDWYYIAGFRIARS
jgi:formylglycine-generating enzyme required for sulfatase activity